MRRIPADRKYTEGHLWFLPTAEDTGLVGITDYLQARLGDLIAVELPRVPSTFAAHDAVASLEGLLETFELEAFSHFEVLEINPKLEIHPDLANRQPYGDGWILKVRLTGVPRWLEAPEYADYLDTGKTQEGA